MYEPDVQCVYFVFSLLIQFLTTYVVRPSQLAFCMFHVLIVILATVTIIYTIILTITEKKCGGGGAIYQSKGWGPYLVSAFQNVSIHSAFYLVQEEAKKFV